MRKLFFAYSERIGEVEAMFDSDGTMLDTWCNNDANWRSEYFNPFMERLGYSIEPAPDWMVEILERHWCHIEGCHYLELDPENRFW